MKLKKFWSVEGARRERPPLDPPLPMSLCSCQMSHKDAHVQQPDCEVTASNLTDSHFQSICY